MYIIRPYSDNDRAYFDDTKLTGIGVILHSNMIDMDYVYFLHRFRCKNWGPAFFSQKFHSDLPPHTNGSTPPIILTPRELTIVNGN